MRSALRALLWLAPREFRGRYGGELLGFYDDRLNEADPGARARVRIVADLCATIAIEWGRVAGTIASPHDHQRTLTIGERMSVIGQEIAHAGRSLRKNAGFTTAAVLTLALGIASTTAIFSIVDSVLLKPLPFPGADRIVIPESKRIGTDDRSSSLSYADFMDWRDRKTFEAVASYQRSEMDLLGAGDPSRVKAVLISPQFFAALGVKPELGQLFANPDFVPGSPRVAVISHELWQTQFGGRENIIGTMTDIDATPRRIIGVLPPRVRWPLDAEVWLPRRYSTEQHPDLQRRDNFIYEGIARLRADATLESTAAAMALIAAQVAKDHGAIRRDVTMVPTPIMRALLGDTTPRALWILLGSVGLLLLIACVNVASLQLARATARQRELAVRTALGASRYRLVRQTLVESGLLGLVGGAIGVVLAIWIIKGIVAAAPPDIPRLESATLSLPALAFGAAVSILIALLAGVIPAAHASRSDPNVAMGESNGRAGTGRATTRARRTLVVAELALAVLLLVGAGLTVRSIQRLRMTRPGFDTAPVLTASVSLPGRYSSDATVRFMYDLQARLAASPGVRGAGITTASPLGAGGFYLGRSMAAQGKPPTRENEISVNWSVATPGYFAALGVPIRGRDFSTHDDTATSPVMIVSESFVKAMFGGGEAIGKRAMSTRDEKVYREIIGVVPDMKFYGMRDSLRALVWVPYAQNYPWGIGNITIRTEGSPMTAIGTLRREVAAIDPKLALANITTMDEAAARSIASDRMVALLLTAFALLALVLAAIGIFGVLSYSVAQRTRELGVRMALGAQRRDVLRLVLRETTPLVAIGIVVGIGVGLGVTRLMSAMLYEIQPRDPVTFIGVPCVLAAVGLLAALLPARRAARVDPLVALRSD